MKGTKETIRRGAILMLLLMLSAALDARSGVIQEPASPAACQAMHDEIEREFRDANHCATDVDCKFIRLGGWYIDFGCYKFVNVSTDENALLDKIDAYKNKMRCSAKINDCSSPGPPACVEKKCVGNKKITD